MHIVLTVNAAWNLVNFRTPLIKALREDGHRLTALVPEDETVPRLNELGCNVVPLAIDSKGLSPLRDARLIRDMRRAFKALAPNAVLSFTIKNNIYGALASRGMGHAFIPNVTGLGTAFLGSTVLLEVAKRLYRAAFRPLPHVLFQNTEDSALFERLRIVRPEQGVVLPGSGIDLEHFAPALPSSRPGEEMVFLMIARVLADKGVREYAEAARILRAHYPAARFRLLGALDVENRTALPATEVESWVANGLIEYPGRAEDVRPAIANADALVLPSYREGMPRVLLEGAAMARPMIATDVPGCREAVKPGKTGFLCDARSGSDLARAMADMITLSPHQREIMGTAARVDMETRFNVERVIATYRRLLDANSTTAKRFAA